MSQTSFVRRDRHSVVIRNLTNPDPGHARDRPYTYVWPSTMTGDPLTELREDALDAAHHSYFAEISDLKVSAHVLIRPCQSGRSASVQLR